MSLPPSEQWRRFGFAFVSTPQSVEIAELIAKLAADRDLANLKRRRLRDGQTHIAGGTLQTKLTELRAKAVKELQARFRECARVELCKLTNTSLAEFRSLGLQFSGTKTLVSETGLGEQMLHYDSSQYMADSPCTTVILYCTNTDSTRLPLFHAPSELQMAGDGSTAAERRRQSPLLQDLRHYFFCPVPAGTFCFFRHFVPHAGVMNTRPDPRVLTFDMIGRRGAMPNPNQQYFWWHYLRDCFGPESPEFLDALIANEHHEPLRREAGAEEARLKPLVAARLAARASRHPQ